MGSNLIRYLCVLMVLFSALQLGEGRKSAAQTEDQDVQVIAITAKKYEFSPSAVHVKAGMRIELKITAIDRDHGFTISVVPEEADAPIHPGLVRTRIRSSDWRRCPGWAWTQRSRSLPKWVPALRQSAITA